MKAYLHVLVLLLVPRKLFHPPKGQTVHCVFKERDIEEQKKHQCSFSIRLANPATRVTHTTHKRTSMRPSLQQPHNETAPPALSLQESLLPASSPVTFAVS